MSGYKVATRKDGLEAISRVESANLPTPLEKLSNISRQIGTATIYMKRDDLTGFCFGGNKERKLEFIMADALKAKATTVVTVGVFQSNHCRMTTAFANKLSLKTELILIENEKGKQAKGGNFLLNQLMGAKIHAVKIDEVQGKIESVLNNLRRSGERPYFIEGGGHNALGAIGYIHAVKELKKQTEDMGISVDYIVLPAGTGTTQAGLILGKRIFGFDAKIMGISISRDRKRCVGEIATVIRKTEEYLRLDSEDCTPHIKVHDEYIGRGYGIPTKEGMKALRLLAEREGLIIDPVYNAKALAGMFDLISKSVIKGNVIYLNTGGLPALFTKNTQNIGGDYE